MIANNFTAIGKNYDQKTILGAVAEASWYLAPCDLPFMPGEAIRCLIREFRIPRVQQVATSHAMAPYGLVGVLGHWKNMHVIVWAVDTGTKLVPVLRQELAA